MTVPVYDYSGAVDIQPLESVTVSIKVHNSFVHILFDQVTATDVDASTFDEFRLLPPKTCEQMTQFSQRWRIMHDKEIRCFLDLAEEMPAMEMDIRVSNDAQTKSNTDWLEHLFYEQSTLINCFYTDEITDQKNLDTVRVLIAQLSNILDNSVLLSTTSCRLLSARYLGRF